MLRELNIPVHRIVYKQLHVAIPCYHQDDTRSLAKDLYPHIAEQFGHTTSQAVEHSIREAIHCGWGNRDPEIWEHYFPRPAKAPSNKQFIAVLAERLEA